MQRRSLRKVLDDIWRELELFQDYETLTRQFFEKNSDAKVLIVGHTHAPTLRLYSDGTTFINTGTWTRMINLDLGQWHQGSALTYAKVIVKSEEYELSDFETAVEVDLMNWMGIQNLPYSEYH